MSSETPATWGAATATLDVREVAPRERHPMIFQRFAALAVGEGFVLVNDHDPRPLYYQLMAEHPGEAGWDYLEAGPEVWQVRISRQAAPGADASGTQG